MVVVNIKNITLQFDLEGDINPTTEMIESQIEIINAIISQQCSWSQPQIILNKEIAEIEVITLI
jgi:hypothetical protein